MENSSIEIEIDNLLDEASSIFISNHKYARNITEQALSLSNASNYEIGKARAHFSLGEIERYRGHNKLAISYYENALELYKNSDVHLRVYACYNNIGIIYVNLGKLEKALDYFNYALNLQIQLNNIQSIAYIKNNIGVIYSRLEKEDTAIKYYTEALEINQQLNNQKTIVKNYINIGTSKHQLNELNEAIDYYKKALEITDKIELDKTDNAMSNSNIAIIYKELNQYEEGLKHAEMAYKTSLEDENKSTIAFSSGILGILYFKTGRVEEAHELLHNALALSIEIDNLEYQLEILNYLSEYYQTQNLWKEAFETTKKRDEINNELKKNELLLKIETSDLKNSLNLELIKRKATEDVLYNTLPKHIADRIQLGEQNITDKHENCCVLFLDIVGFTEWSSNMPVETLTNKLNSIFESFDVLCNKFSVEKIKTIGDAYLCVNGISEQYPSNAYNMANLALALQENMIQNYPNNELQIRIGIHTGNVIAGVLGKNKLAYDIWGDTVNTASRMESTGEAGRINISEDFMNLINDKFVFEKRQKTEIKGKGELQTYFLIK